MAVEESAHRAEYWRYRLKPLITESPTGITADAAIIEVRQVAADWRTTEGDQPARVGITDIRVIVPGDLLEARAGLYALIPVPAALAVAITEAHYGADEAE